MPNRDGCDQLLERIDAVLSECSKDPRRRPPARRLRAAWTGPSWVEEQQAVHVNGFRRTP